MMALKGLVVIALIRLGRAAFRAYTKSPNAEKGPQFECAWKMGQMADLYVYLSQQPIQTKFDNSDLIVERQGLLFAPGSIDVSAGLPVDLKRYQGLGVQNSRLYAHVYLCRAGVHPNPDKQRLAQSDVVYRRLSAVGTATKLRPLTNLLSPQTTADASAGEEQALYWYPDLRINLVTMDGPLSTAISPTARPFFTIDWRSNQYLPILYSFEKWQLKAKRQYLTADTSGVTLNLTIGTMSFWAFQWYSALGEAFARSAADNAAFSDDFEQLKELLTETAPWLLLLTLLVTLLHSLFDFLAFKADVQFWRGRKDGDIEGISFRTLVINIACQSVIFLYLLDQGSSRIILISALASLAIDLWKLEKIVEFTWHGPRLRAKYKGSRTEEYDGQAVKVLSVAILPLVAGYAAYSLLYNEHRSWVSYLLHTAVGFVYAFGFVLMTPQLFINYKLKSVAHLPWRAFAYKALNTFIDDLFAFVIRMPLLHRVACFRDDILFLVYMYQRWIYRVDKTRTNEFGQSFGPDEPKGGD